VFNRASGGFLLSRAEYSLSSKLLTALQLSLTFDTEPCVPCILYILYTACCQSGDSAPTTRHMTCVLDAHDHTGDAAAAGRVLALMRRSSKSSSSSSSSSEDSSSSSAKVNPAALLSGARAHARAGKCEIALQLLDEVCVLNTCILRSVMCIYNDTLECMYR
jgi:hypothetical protein